MAQPKHDNLNNLMLALTMNEADSRKKEETRKYGKSINNNPKQDKMDGMENHLLEELNQILLNTTTPIDVLLHPSFSVDGRKTRRKRLGEKSTNGDKMINLSLDDIITKLRTVAWPNSAADEWKALPADYVDLCSAAAQAVPTAIGKMTCYVDGYATDLLKANNDNTMNDFKAIVELTVIPSMHGVVKLLQETISPLCRTIGAATTNAYTNLAIFDMEVEADGNALETDMEGMEGLKAMFEKSDQDQCQLDEWKNALVSFKNASEEATRSIAEQRRENTPFGRNVRRKEVLREFSKVRTAIGVGSWQDETVVDDDGTEQGAALGGCPGMGVHCLVLKSNSGSTDMTKCVVCGSDTHVACCGKGREKCIICCMMETKTTKTVGKKKKKSLESIPAGALYFKCPNCDYVNAFRTVKEDGTVDPALTALAARIRFSEPDEVNRKWILNDKGQSRANRKEMDRSERLASNNDFCTARKHFWACILECPEYNSRNDVPSTAVPKIFQDKRFRMEDGDEWKAKSKDEKRKANNDRAALALKRAKWISLKAYHDKETRKKLELTRETLLPVYPLGELSEDSD